ncbi:MAG: imidazole glycerol phosphate synthase subunit HisH [Pseudomonadota bacterium]|nr:imidazole glycerol phosphate synthase subunit HisH [Pseudomonadota bacterium]
MKVVLIDAGGANIGSVRYALQRLGTDAQLSADPGEIGSADRVILPGVGAAAPAMARLHQLGLVNLIRELRQPLLGICLGMQLLYDSSEEGDVACLGLVPGRVSRMRAAPGVRVPHMGWNRLQPVAGSPLTKGLGTQSQAYFVHSFAAPLTADTIASCTHGNAFTAVVGRGNRFGAQFHPERSATTGARLLENFLAGAVA